MRSTMIAVGLTAPMASQMLAYSGVAAAGQPVYKPNKRGGGGALKVLWWQAPTLLNPHLAVGIKGLERIFMNRWPDGMPMAISSWCWLRKFPR